MMNVFHFLQKCIPPNISIETWQILSVSLFFIIAFLANILYYGYYYTTLLVRIIPSDDFTAVNKKLLFECDCANAKNSTICS